ncbi:hypothetical protein K505DRAFT_323357 [Melanomma pulvis-pyrius CBS 109.77]|uniref:CoA-dependent acyltransferase n=1 Tax=Melanomma pulvis-pyrius CBS 109.77 TaxID=1314802 RepID=A0A6A6XJE3_9PLEO|nr:hypothetical protein K505DRAFT_323357 [Melanomma pulvis-pyrius CBS 109.77]
MEDLSWKETRPGRWERPQSCLEKINLLNRNVKKALDRDNWAKTAVAKLEFNPSLGDPASALKVAWKQVRYNYPEIAAFPYNGIYMYRIGNPEQVSLWVSATFSVVEHTSVDELLGHIPRNEQMMCYYLPNTSEILIRSPHYRLDARGAIFCLNNLIQSLADLYPVLIFGGCANNLSPSIDDALDIPSKPTPEIEAAVTKRLAASKSHKPALELTPTITSALPGVTKRCFISLSKGETQSVIASCASAAMDLPTALHAALVNAVTKIAPPSEAKSFMASFHSDLRFLITKDVTTKQAPTSCTSVITSEIDVSPSTNFKSYYSQLAPVYAAGYAPYLKSTGIFHERLAKSMDGKGGVDVEADGQLQPRFASLGVIDEMLTKDVGAGVVRVKGFWIGTETLTMRMMVHTWIWEDQMVFSVCYNESFWDDALVQRLLDAIRDTVLVELALGGLMKGVAL